MTGTADPYEGADPRLAWTLRQHLNARRYTGLRERLLLKWRLVKEAIRSP